MCGLHLNNKGMTDKTADGGISPAGNAAVVPTAVDFDSTNIKDTVKSECSNLKGEQKKRVHQKFYLTLERERFVLGGCPSHHLLYS